MIDPNLLIDRNKAALTVQNFEFSDLVVYIEKRLRGVSILPPMETGSDETPEYFLEKLYEQIRDEDFKSRFRKAIAALICRELPEIPDPDYLDILLVLCEEFIIEEAVIPVAGLALSGRLKRVNSRCGNLHRQVLLALARMPGGLKMTDIWVNSIPDPRYTAAAFAALRTQGLEKICQNLPSFIRMSWEVPDSLDIDIAVKTIYDEFQERYPDEQITRRLLKSTDNEPDEIRQKLESILSSLNKELPSNEIYYTKERDIEVMRLKNELFKELTQKDIDPKNAWREIDRWQWIAEIEKKPGRVDRWKNLTINYMM